MRVLFLDCPSGISGDMTVGALCDLGVKPSTLEWELSKLEIGDFHMHFERDKRQNVEGIKFGIHEGAVHNHGAHSHEGQSHEGHSHEGHSHEGHSHEGHSHEGHSHEGHSHEGHSHEKHSHEGHSHAGHGCAHDHSHGHEVHVDDEHQHGAGCDHAHGLSHRKIRELIEKSELSDFVKKHALGIFQRIAVAEGKIHGQPPEDVEFHEVGALDSIADIVCVCVGIETLGIEKVFVSHLQEGHGVIKCAHGIFPVPAPATLEILKGVALGQIDEPHELITPTGAAIAMEFGASFGLMPRIKIDAIGYGLGSRDLASRPNVLRAVLGELVEE